MPDPQLIEAIGSLSATSLFVLAIVALVTRKIRTAGEAAEIEARHERERAEDRKERDDWKAMAIAEQEGRVRLYKLMEDKLDIKVPPP